jgi:hypothetical protein
MALAYKVLASTMRYPYHTIAERCVRVLHDTASHSVRYESTRATVSTAYVAALAYSIIVVLLRHITYYSRSVTLRRV